MSGERVPEGGKREERVLILAPVGRDAQLATQALSEMALATHVCRDLDEVRREIPRGAGAVLVTDEALDMDAAGDPGAWVGPEPPWSQLPLVVLTGARLRPQPRLQALRRLERRRNVSFLQRPVSRLTLASTVRAALEGRRRQYVVRDLLAELEEGVRQRDEFLATLGHELRNPMAAIANGLELLRDEVAGSNETARAAGEVMERQMEHLSRLLDDLLDVSRITRGKLELRRVPVDVGRTTRNVADAFGFQIQERDQHLALTLPDHPAWVKGDEFRLEQVLWNLLSNASKYTPIGGHIEVSLVAEDGRAVVRVADEGQGMTRDFLARAFDVFAQAEVGAGGLGLGLPLSRRLAELHRGSLVAESEGPGHGSVFTLELPLMAHQEPPVPMAPSTVTGSCRVLVVEDNEDLAWSMERVLQKLGQDVRRVGTGADALTVACEYRPDVVLLDIGLPDMHGADVAVELRARLGRSTILAAMSGFGQEDVRRRSLASGCDRHLTKPVAMKELQELLDVEEPPAS